VTKSDSFSTQPGLRVIITSPDLCGLKLFMILLRLPLPKSFASNAEYGYAAATPVN
jgi:hypothetical protein